MSKQKKKIPVSDFVSDKKLDKILNIIKKSDDVEMNYDRIEMLLSDDFDVKDLGTNRIVFVHKKKKYKDYIFKVAGDSHGIEANYREFYNGDLDKRLTYSYSISSNGVFIVQEKVTRMTKDDMKKYKKDVREMLHHLSKKILLVDCKISNFKNFGIRKNGDVCLLDHGDTVPLPDYQRQEIVNSTEESYVSLRCKKMECASDSKPRPCGGKLKYSKDFDTLVCDRCGSISPVHEAYREFYGDKRIKTKGSTLILDNNFDPDEWKEHIKQYCIQTMSDANIKNNKEEGENEMKTKIIDGQNCAQIKGYWLPIPENKIILPLYNSVKMGMTTPKDYLRSVGIKNTDDYKVMSSDHTPSEKKVKHHDENVSSNDNSNNAIEEIAASLIDIATDSKQFQTLVQYINIPNPHNVDLGDMKNITTIRKLISDDARVCGCIYNEEGFSIRIKANRDNDGYKKKFEKASEKASYVKDYLDKDNDAIVVEDVNNNEPDEISYPNPDIGEHINEEEWLKKHEKRDNSYEDDMLETPKKSLVLTENDIENSTYEYNGEKCVVIGKYALPFRIIITYINENGDYELPTRKIKTILKSHNLSPKKYKITEYNESVENNSTDSTVTNTSEVAEDDIPESVQEEIVNKDNQEYVEHDDWGEWNETEWNTFDPNNSEELAKFSETLYKIAYEYKDIADESGYVYIDPEEILDKLFIDNNYLIPEELSIDSDGNPIPFDEYLSNVYIFINANIYKPYKNNDNVAKIDSLSIDYNTHSIGLYVKEFNKRNIGEDEEAIDGDVDISETEEDDTIPDYTSDPIKTNSDINNNINENNEEECDLTNPEVIELLKSTNEIATKTLEAVNQSINALNATANKINTAVNMMNEKNKQDLNYMISPDGQCIKFNSKDLMGKFITIEYNDNMVALDCTRIINDAVAQCPGKSIVDRINVKYF